MSYKFPPGSIAQSPQCRPNTITNHGSFMVPGHRLHPRPKPYPNCPLDRTIFPQGQQQGMPIAHRQSFPRIGGPVHVPRCIQLSSFQQAMLNGQRPAPHLGSHLHRSVSQQGLPLQGRIDNVHQPVLRSLLEAPVFKTAKSSVTYTPEYNMALAMVLINNHESNLKARRQMLLQEMAGNAPARPHSYAQNNKCRPEPAMNIAPPHMLLKDSGSINQAETSSLPAFASNKSCALGRITPPPLPPSILLKNYHLEETSSNYSYDNNGKASFFQGCRTSRYRELKKDASTRNGHRQLPPGRSGVAMSTVQLERVVACQQQFTGCRTREGTLWNDGSICGEESVTMKVKKTLVKTPAYDYSLNGRSGVGMTDEDSRYVHKGQSSSYGGGCWETSEADYDDTRCVPGEQHSETGYRMNYLKRKVPNVFNSAEPCQKSPKIDTEWLVENQAHNMPSPYGKLVSDEVQEPIDNQADMCNYATQMSSGYKPISMCQRLPKVSHDNLVHSFPTEIQDDDTVTQAVDPYRWASRPPNAPVNSDSSESLYKNDPPKIYKTQYPRDNQAAIVTGNAIGFESSDTSHLSSALHTGAESKGGCKPRGEACFGGISHLKETKVEDFAGYLQVSQGENTFFKMFKLLNQKRIADMQKNMTTSSRASTVLDSDVSPSLQSMPRDRSGVSQNALHGLPYDQPATVLCARKPEESPRSVDANVALKITVIRGSNSTERTSAQNEDHDLSLTLTSPMTIRTHFPSSCQNVEKPKKRVHFAEDIQTHCKLTKNGQTNAEKYICSKKMRSLGDRFGKFLRFDECLKSNKSKARKGLSLFEEPDVIPSQSCKLSVATTKLSKTRDVLELNVPRKGHSQLHVPNKKGRPAKRKPSVTIDISSNLQKDDSNMYKNTAAVVKKIGRHNCSKNNTSISASRSELQKPSLHQQCFEADGSDPVVGSVLVKREKSHGKKGWKGNTINSCNDEVAIHSKKSKGNTVKKHVSKSKKHATSIMIPSPTKKKSVETGVRKKLEHQPGGKNKQHRTSVVVSTSNKTKFVEPGVGKKFVRPPGSKDKKHRTSDKKKSVETYVRKKLDCPSGSNIKKHRTSDKKKSVETYVRKKLDCPSGSKVKKHRTSVVISSPKKKSIESSVRKKIGSKVQKPATVVMVSPPAKSKSVRKMRVPTGHKNIISTDGKKDQTKLMKSILNGSKLIQEKVLTPLRVIVSRLSESFCKDEDSKIRELVKGEKSTKSHGKRKKRIDGPSGVPELDGSLEERGLLYSQRDSVLRPIVVDHQKCQMESMDSHGAGTNHNSDVENGTSNGTVLADGPLEDKFQKLPILDDESINGYASESSLSDIIPYMDQENDQDESGIFTMESDKDMKKTYNVRNELCSYGSERCWHELKTSADGGKAKHENINSKDGEQRESVTNSFPTGDSIQDSTNPEIEVASRSLEPSCRMVGKHLSEADYLLNVNCTDFTGEEPSGRSNHNHKSQKTLSTMQREGYKDSVSCGNELLDEDEYFHKRQKRSYHQLFSKRNKKKHHDKKRNTNVEIDKECDHSKCHENELHSHKKKHLQSSGTDGSHTKQKHLQSSNTHKRHSKKKSMSKHHHSHGSKAKGKGPSRSKSKVWTDDSRTGSGKTPVPRITLHMIQGDQLTRPRLSLRTCVYCQAFSTRLAHMMREHVKVVHPYKCKSCHIPFKEQVEMAAHKLTQHQMEVHHCTLCRQVFMTKYRLDQHMTCKSHRRLMDAQREAMNAICKAVHKNQQLCEDSFTDTLKTIGYQESALWNPGKKNRKALLAPGDVSTAPPPQCPNLSHLRHFYYDNPELKEVVRKFSNVYKSPEAAVGAGHATSSMVSVNDSKEIFYFPLSDMEKSDTWTVTRNSEEVSKVTSVENCTYTSVENHDMMDMNLCESLGAAISEWDNQLHPTEEFGQKGDTQIEAYPNESFFEEVLNYDSLDWDDTQSGETCDYQLLQPVKATTGGTDMITDFVNTTSVYPEMADGSVALAAREFESQGPMDSLELMDCSSGGRLSEVARTNLDNTQDCSRSSTFPMRNLCKASNAVDNESDAGQLGELKKNSKESMQHLVTANEQDDSVIYPNSDDSSPRLPLPLIIPISTELKTKRQDGMKCIEFHNGIDVYGGLNSQPEEASLDMESGNAHCCGETVTGADISNGPISSPKDPQPLKLPSSVPCPANSCVPLPVRLPMPATTLRPSTSVLDNDDVSRLSFMGSPGGNSTQGCPERNPVLIYALPAVDDSTSSISPMSVKQSSTKHMHSPLKILSSVSFTKTSHANLTMCVPLPLNIPSPLPMKIYSSVLNKTENTTVRTVTNFTLPLPLKLYNQVDVCRRLCMGHQKGLENASSLIHPDIISEAVQASGIPGHFGMDSTTVLWESILMPKLPQAFRPVEHPKMLSVCKHLMIDSSIMPQSLKLFTLEDFHKQIGCEVRQTLAIGNSVQHESDVLPGHHPVLSSTSSCGLSSQEEFSDHYCSGSASGGTISGSTASVCTESSQSCVSQGNGDVSEEEARTSRGASSDSGMWESNDSVSAVGGRRLPENHGVCESGDSVSGVGVRNLPEKHIQIQMDLLLREIAEGESATFQERN